MSPSIRLADPTMGQLLTLTEEDWTSINRFIAIVLGLRKGWSIIGQGLPDFETFAAVTCATWRTTTFPGVSKLANSISTYADRATASLKSLHAEIASLKDGEELSPETLSHARQFFSDLGGSTGQLSRQATPIKNGINDFATRYIQYATIATLKFGGSVAADKAAVAASELNSAWHTVTDDLWRVTSGEVPITSTLLLSLDVDLALRSWAGLRSEAVAYRGIVPGQQTILDTGWKAGFEQQ